MKNVTTCLVALTCSLSASLIPQYTIDSIDQGETVSFTNNAILDVIYKDWTTVQSWNVGDTIELMSRNIMLFISRPNHTKDGRLHFSPTFLLKNLTKHEEAIVSLKIPPTAPNAGVFLIQAINYATQTIQLNDSTLWIYPKEDQHAVNFWQVNDLIMIGLNDSFSSASFDSILFNTDRLNMAKAIQQQE